MKKNFKLVVLILFVFLLSGCVKYNVESEISNDLKFNLHYTYTTKKNPYLNYDNTVLPDEIKNRDGFDVELINDEKSLGIDVFSVWDNIDILTNNTDLDVSSYSSVDEIKNANIDFNQITIFDIDEFLYKDKDKIKLFNRKEYEDKTAYFSVLNYTPRSYYNVSNGQFEVMDIIYDPNDDIFAGSEFYFNIKLPSVAKNIKSNTNIDRENELDLGWKLSYKDLSLNIMYFYFEIPKDVERLEVTKSLLELKNSNYTLNDLFKVDGDEDVVWSSSDESIAKVEGRKIFFFKAGELDITGLGKKKYKLHLVITEEGILNPETRNSFVIIELSVITCIALFVIDKIYRKKKRKQ